ncbi:LacI family DNA-binding transcriptional regulator [Neobacillus drentensis]|uniref:HTH-type transcriptional repressor PurR n=1 Tax=Neobacillus rhizosphaerae TaxID=2880965 RepID=A0ABM9EKN4_9BACI|nr:LacI family DNA-binding transcriptional regulator [Neobacillus rhizosphaerae]CAH2713146.1 HTH-type transcriptional repressor PurR [Neobacillus rhizosphaerae]
MKVSIYDVANLAGVSISTVSRVLNKSGYVSSKTEKKVYDAVEKLNFIPNVIAQNLANNETKLIGLYFTSLPNINVTSSNTYILEFIKGVNEVLIRWGYHLLLINEINDIKKIMSNQCKPQYYSFIKQKRIDGLIIGTTPILCSSFFELLDHKMPMVFIGEKILNHTGLNVYAQYKQYSRDILDYFYDQNHRYINVLSMEKEIMGSVIREFEIEKKDEELKLEHFLSPLNLDSYLDLLGTIFTQKNKPTGLLVEDTSKVQQTINFLNNLNLDAPNDVSIITIEHKFQDGEQCLPAVTSVYVPAYQMAFEATTMLFEYLQGNQDFNKEVIVDSKIIERDSVKSIDRN